MTSYIKKMPAAVGVIFFGVAGFFAMYTGATIITACIRGAVAGACAWAFFALIFYVVFEEDIPEPSAPEGLEWLEKKFRRDK